MATIGFVRGRIHKYLRHRYTRQARQAGSMVEDAWGDPLTDHNTPIEPDLLCYFMDAGSYLQGGGGLMQVNVPTLVIEYTDALKVGDHVLSVVDPTTGFALVRATAEVEMIGDIATSGPILYRIASLRYAEVA